MQKGAISMRKAKIDLHKAEREQQKKQQRKKWILRSILILAIVACLVVAGIFAYRKYEEQKYLEQLRSNFVDYNAFREDLNALAEFLQTTYEDEATRPSFLLVAGSDLVDTTGKPIMLPQKMKSAVKNISQNCFSLTHYRWRMVSFFDDRIQFDSNDGNYALIFSPEGEPTFLHQEGEDYDILVEHIEGPWYHVMRIN